MSEEPKRQQGTLEADAFAIRILRRDDLDAVVAIDQAASGRRRVEYFRSMLDRALEHGTVQVSLVAEAGDEVAGVIVASLSYGEFGIAEPSASIEAIGVAPQWRRQGVGGALMRQLRKNLGALGVTTLRSEVSWDDFDLLRFFSRHGFAPAQRLCLEKTLDPTAPDE